MNIDEYMKVFRSDLGIVADFCACRITREEMDEARRRLAESTFDARRGSISAEDFRVMGGGQPLS